MNLLLSDIGDREGRVARHSLMGSCCLVLLFKKCLLISALLEDGKPKDVKSDLRRDADTHWNLILPQIIYIIVVLKVLKLPRECSLEYLYPTQIIFYLLTAATMRS